MALIAESYPIAKKRQFPASNATNFVDDGDRVRFFVCVLNVAERTCTVYFADFVTFEGDRYYVTSDLRTGKTRIDRVSNEAFERFIRNVLTMPDPLAETSKQEVSA